MDLMRRTGLVIVAILAVHATAIAEIRTQNTCTREA